jgi:tRNA(Arg) A34 adenosine deaminase TadA
MEQHEHKWMREAIRLAEGNVGSGQGGPFGAVVVRNGEVIARGSNQVTAWNDPTAHAEVVAIRAACEALGHFQLTGCDLYTSCEPCPMCLGAIYWARPDRVFFANTRQDAAHIGFDDAFIYEELTRDLHERKIEMIPLLRNEALHAFSLWKEKGDKTLY